jgi:CRP/FNR family transcriptional regulator, nitrogen oxide reductase regulator
LVNELNHLRMIPLFQNIEDGELKAIFEASRTKIIPENGFFFYQGDPADRLYVLTAGKVKLSQIAMDGQQIILNVIGTWEMFGLIAFTQEGTYPATAEAAAECHSLSWSSADLRALSERSPRLALNGMQIMAGRVHEFQDRIRELSTERVERRLARVLLRLVRQVGKKADEGVLIDLPISRKDLAEMCGTTLYTVSRILSQWEREKIVAIGRERVVIRFPHGLVRIAEDIPDNPSAGDLSEP